MAKTRFIVSALSDASVEKVAAALEKAGAQIEDKFDEISTLVVSAEAAQLKSLAKVPGVDSIEREEEFDIGPPDDEMQ
ncbi:MAG TPA: hypothetical protein VF824_02545 [Thermoanaerobaculia bacterium]|jgi:flavin reductase (DIM6/NTAB) family NADH-FMN oxidoreductase RutF